MRRIDGSYKALFVRPPTMKRLEKTLAALTKDAYKRGIPASITKIDATEMALNDWIRNVR